jgi:hypothetical protein
MLATKPPSANVATVQEVGPNSYDISREKCGNMQLWKRLKNAAQCENNWFSGL